ncbi:MAG TPA: GreA/GreB family elongation factor [Candidatus Saccharimonadales bacterium]|nr:GreA/GreB family elongation factor [Candidatus Saccharimonadales bacterium]
MARKSKQASIKQLKQSRNALRHKLVELNESFINNPSSFDSNISFALAQRHFIQGNLERIERQLLLARVSSSAATNQDRVGIGNVVYVQRGSDIRAIMLIPAAGADPNVEYVSANSSLGKSLLGKSKGEMVEIGTSLGKQNYGILRIA